MALSKVKLDQMATAFLKKHGYAADGRKPAERPVNCPDFREIRPISGHASPGWRRRFKRP